MTNYQSTKEAEIISNLNKEAMTYVRSQLDYLERTFEPLMRTMMTKAYMQGRHDGKAEEQISILPLVTYFPNAITVKFLREEGIALDASPAAVAHKMNVLRSIGGTKQLKPNKQDILQLFIQSLCYYHPMMSTVDVLGEKDRMFEALQGAVNAGVILFIKDIFNHVYRSKNDWNQTSLPSALQELPQWKVAKSYRKRYDSTPLYQALYQYVEQEADKERKHLSKCSRSWAIKHVVQYNYYNVLKKWNNAEKNGVSLARFIGGLDQEDGEIASTMDDDEAESEEEEDFTPTTLLVDNNPSLGDKRPREEDPEEPTEFSSMPLFSSSQ